MHIFNTRLAGRIADELLTLHGDDSVIGDRLQIMRKEADGTETEHGGRCRSAIVAVIDRHLSEAIDRL